MKPAFRAYGNRIFVEVEPIGVTKGGIQMPDNVEVSTVARGTVISVGPGVMTTMGWDAPRVVIGDEIVFPRVKGLPVPDAGKFIVTLWAGDILGVLSTEELPRHD